MERQEIKEYLKRTKYHYFNVNSGGNICVATANNEERNRIFFGASFCSPKDKFSKRKGRLEALKRLYENLKEENLIHNNNYFPPTTEEAMVFSYYLGTLITLSIVPNWLMKAVKGKNVLSVVKPRKLPKSRKELQGNQVVLW